MTLTRINTTATATATNTKVNTSVYRFGNRWNVNECLRLQREYELLKLSVPEIAALHGRTIKAIIYKISAEGFASFNDLFVNLNFHFINTKYCSINRTFCAPDVS